MTTFEGLLKEAISASLDAQQGASALFRAREGDPYAYPEPTAGIGDVADKLAAKARSIAARMRDISDDLGAESWSISVGFPTGIQLSATWVPDRRPSR